MRARLGEPDDLPSVEEAKAKHKQDVAGMFRRMAKEAQDGFSQERTSLQALRDDMVARHRKERSALDRGQAARWQKEAAARSARLRRGLSGIWQVGLPRITGSRAKVSAENEHAAYAALQRDQAQRQRLIDAQLAERHDLEDRWTRLRREALGLVKDLRSERDRVLEKLTRPEAQTLRRRRRRGAEQDPDMGPEI